MHWLKLLKNNLNQHLFKSKHLRVSYLEESIKFIWAERKEPGHDAAH